VGTVNAMPGGSNAMMQNIRATDGHIPASSSSSAVPKKSTGKKSGFHVEMSKSKKRKWVATLSDAAKNHVWNISSDGIPDIDEVTLDRLADLSSEELNLIFVEAIRTGNLDAAKLILNPKVYRLDINAQDEYQRTGLHWAILERQSAFVIDFILSRSDINTDGQDCDGNTPLAIATERGLVDVVAKLVPMHPRAINIPNHERWTPFHEAVDKDNCDIVKIFINQLEQHSLQDNDRTCFYQQKDDQETILHIAAYRGNSDIVGRLLNHLMNVSTKPRDIIAVLEITNSDESDCLDIAREERYKDVVTLLRTAVATFEANLRFEVQDDTSPTLELDSDQPVQWACGAWGVHRCPFESSTHRCYPIGGYPNYEGSSSSPSPSSLNPSPRTDMSSARDDTYIQIEGGDC